MTDSAASGSTGADRRRTSNSPGYQRQNFSVITDAKAPTSEEMSGRIRKYAITMGFRTLCFVAMIFVPGVGRWILFGCAVFLPYVAVLFANQAHTRGQNTRVEHAPPVDAPQLTTGPVEGEIISGSVVDDDEDHGTYERRDRVA